MGFQKKQSVLDDFEDDDFNLDDDLFDDESEIEEPEEQETGKAFDIAAADEEENLDFWFGSRRRINHVLRNLNGVRFGLVRNLHSTYRRLDLRCIATLPI